MPRFSERKGLKAARTVVQWEDMDDPLRNGLWTALHIHFWSEFAEESSTLSSYTKLSGLMSRIWTSYFKFPLDTLPWNWQAALRTVRDYFFKCEWYEVYDFIEFVNAGRGPFAADELFERYCNSIMEHEMSAYRFVSSEITEITSAEEIEAIESAIKESPRGAKAHLQRALELLSDRKLPDYRNSIKESISAVETICRLIVGKPKATLGQAIGKVKARIPIHPALEKAFDSLYGYTSDEQGIRHSLLDEPDLDFDDAKFMLVSCAAFVNHLLSKAAKASIKL